jgi:hypothetical protein
VKLSIQISGEVVGKYIWRESLDITKPHHASYDLVKIESLMNTTLDVAAALNAIVWPIVVLIILLTYRKPLRSSLNGVSGRLMKFSTFDISIERAVLPPVPAK